MTVSYLLRESGLGGDSWGENGKEKKKKTRKRGKEKGELEKSRNQEKKKYGRVEKKKE